MRGVRVLVVVAGGVAVGALTNLGGRYLPVALREVDDSVGAWTLAATALTLLGRRWWTAALLGFVAFMAMLGGYEVVARLDGFATRPAQWMFWGAAALVVGPLLGALAHRGRRDAGVWRSLAVAVVGGILVGEGVWGLTDEAASASAYWWVQVTVGTALLAAIGWRGRTVRQAVPATALTAAVAATFVVVYRLPLYWLVL